MLNVNESAELLSISSVRVKQLLKELNPEEYSNKTKYGRVTLSHTEIRSLLQKREIIFKKRKVTIGMEKGGVGKSLLTINAAVRAAQKGAKVLLIDLDPESCATNFLLTEEQALNPNRITMLEIFKDKTHTFETAAIPTKIEGLSLVPCKGKARRVDRYIRDENLSTLMKEALGSLSDYDLVFFEVPPTFTNIITMAYMSSDLVIMPSFPDAWSLESVLLTQEDIGEACNTWGVRLPEIRILMNKYMSSRTASEDAWDVLTKQFGGKVLGFQIPDKADIQNAINDGLTVWEYKKSNKQSREAIDNLVNYVLVTESYSLKGEVVQ